MRSPIKWFGGKGNFTQHLLPLIPDHKCYVEVFGGGASLLFAKPPSKVEVYNDIDGDVVAFFRLFHDDEAMEEFKRKCHYTPYSREWFIECRDTWRECKGIERVYRWFVMRRMEFSGRLHDNNGVSLSGQGNKARVFSNTVDGLDMFVDRIRNVQIDNRSWEHIIPLYDSPNTFFYLDPPYIHDTRTDDNSYPNEMSNDGHQHLVEMLTNIKGRVLLSGYSHQLYDGLTWEKADIDVVCWGANTKQANKPQRTEILWRNYEIQPTLF